MTAHGFPTVTLGCGQHNIHTVDEYLDLDEFETACEIAFDLAGVRQLRLSLRNNAAARPRTARWPGSRATTGATPAG